MFEIKLVCECQMIRFIDITWQKMLSVTHYK